MGGLLPIQLMICYNENLARALPEGWEKRQRFESIGLGLLLHVPMARPCLFPSVSEEEARSTKLSTLRGLDGWVFKALPPCWGFRSSARARAAPLQHVYLLCGVCLLCRTLTCCSNSAAVNVNLEGAHRGPYSPGSQGSCVPTAAQPRGVRGPWKLLNPCGGCREPDTVEDLWFVVFFLFNFIPASGGCFDG